MTNYLDCEHLLMFTFFVKRSFLQIYGKQNKENEKQNKNLRDMYRDTPEIEYSYRLRVFIRQLCTSLLFVYRMDHGKKHIFSGIKNQ